MKVQITLLETLYNSGVSMPVVVEMRQILRVGDNGLMSVCHLAAAAAEGGRGTDAASWKKGSGTGGWEAIVGRVSARSAG